MTDHCFVVPAHGESPHLEECLRSLAAQTIPSRIIVTTSTPNPLISGLAARYATGLHVNERQEGIGADWNFALDAADATWVTLAHQDDVYVPDFLAQTLLGIERHPEALLVLTDYAESIDGRTRSQSTLLRIKRVLLELGFLGGTRASSRFLKTNTLRFGCAIACPTVTLNLAKTRLRFRTDLRVDLDWAAWLDLARRAGDFVYIRRPLMLHRVHAASETTGAIADGHRAREDADILRQLWPRFIANAIAATYRIAYRSNEVRPAT
ncbi:MAG TPA: glycosyltransferase [Lysobacter sp.]